jgi:hypothetical protein
MGTNKIGALFQPTYYVKTDYSQFSPDDWHDEVIPMLGCRACLLWDVFRDGVKDKNQPFGDHIPEGLGEIANVTWVPRCEHHGYPIQVSSEPNWHEPFCTAYNTISVMAQWAVKLGYKEIILVGCDLNYSDGIKDHFMVGREPTTLPYYSGVDEAYVERATKATLAAHEFIKEKCPIPVYNATLGGALEVHERVNFYELVELQ